jgi:hypothetical protein
MDLDPEGPLRFTPVLLPALTYWHISTSTISTSIKTSKKVYWCPPHPHPWMTWRRLPASRFPPPCPPAPSRFHQPSRLSSMGNNHHRFITRDLTLIMVMSPPLAMSIIRRISNNPLSNSSRGRRGRGLLFALSVIIFCRIAKNAIVVIHVSRLVLATDLTFSLNSLRPYVVTTTVSPLSLTFLYPSYIGSIDIYLRFPPILLPDVSAS